MDHIGLMTVHFPDKAFRDDSHFVNFANALSEDTYIGRYVDHCFKVEKGQRLPKGNKAKRKTYLLTFKCDTYTPKEKVPEHVLACKQANIDALRQYFLPFLEKMMLDSVAEGRRTKASVRLIKYDIWEIEKR